MRSWRFQKQKWFGKISVQVITERFFVRFHRVMYYSITRANGEKRREYFKRFREYKLSSGKPLGQIACLDVQLP